MLAISRADLQHSGGLLAALADKSVEYIHSILHGLRPQPSEKLDRLERVIVHCEPHVDEYLGDLLFRACLPREKWRLEFAEQSLFSSTADRGCRMLWPTSAVMGIGRTYGGGEQYVFMFDEHVPNEANGPRRRIAPSCSQMVADRLIGNVPKSIQTVLREVNIIDECGGAHDQNLANLIKTLHDVRFQIAQGSGKYVTEAMTPDWKRAIVDACLAAVVYCLENRVDLTSNWSEQAKVLKISLNNYVEHSRHRQHPRFSDAVHRIKTVFLDQNSTFASATLLDTKQNVTIQQLLIIARLCYACDACWGDQLRDIIVSHFWEGEFQNQLNFYLVQEQLDALFEDNQSRRLTSIGTFTRNILPDIELGPGATPRKHRGRPEPLPRTAPLWILTLTTGTEVPKANKALSNYLNNHNFGCGLFLIRNTVFGTNALFKGNAIAKEKWRKLASAINDLEKGYWYVLPDAPWIINGTKAHQYVPRSALDDKALVELVKGHLH